MSKQANRDKAIALMEKYLETIGFPVGPETDETPRRIVDMHLNEFAFTEGEPPFKMTLFSKTKRHKFDQLIVEKDLEFHSWCAHHILPYFGEMHVGYLPDEHIVGISKIPRVIAWFSARPTSQEFLVEDIADFLMESIKPRALYVTAQAKHTCVACRGAKSPRALTQTSVVRVGKNFSDEIAYGILKKEFFDLIAMRG